MLTFHNLRYGDRTYAVFRYDCYCGQTFAFTDEIAHFHAISGGVVYSASELREIADALDKLNAGGVL
jgi:hypothetical protein